MPGGDASPYQRAWLHLGTMIKKTCHCKRLVREKITFREYCLSCIKNSAHQAHICETGPSISFLPYLEVGGVIAPVEARPGLVVKGAHRTNLLRGKHRQLRYLRARASEGGPGRCLHRINCMVMLQECSRFNVPSFEQYRCSSGQASIFVGEDTTSIDTTKLRSPFSSAVALTLPPRLGFRNSPSRIFVKEHACTHELISGTAACRMPKHMYPPVVMANDLFRPFARINGTYNHCDLLTAPHPISSQSIAYCTAYE